jgi:deoxyribose-phosphate aldolase
MMSRHTLHLPQTPTELAGYLDDTRLTFEVDQDVDAILDQLCQDARTYSMRAVCVRPEHVARVKHKLEGTSTRIATVIGFPLDKQVLSEQQLKPTIGDAEWEIKAHEIERALAAGADEFDVVLNIPFFKMESTRHKDNPATYEVIQLVRVAQGHPVKLIIETDLLNDEEIVLATRLGMSAGVATIKTSTGMLIGGQGAQLETVQLIGKAIAEANMKTPPNIKASGGIKTIEQALKLLRAGAAILGTSQGAQLAKALLS